MEGPHAPQRACIDDVCQVIDIEQAYLNAPQGSFKPTSTRGTLNDTASDEGGYQGGISAAQETATSATLDPELSPVLIWSMTGLDDKIGHTLRLALAPLPSADDAEMSITKIVYTSVHYGWGQKRPDIPAPQLDNSYEGPLHPPHSTKWSPGIPPEHPAPLLQPLQQAISPISQSPSPSPTATSPCRTPPNIHPLALFTITFFILLTIPMLFVLRELADPRSGSYIPETPIVRLSMLPPCYELRRPSNSSAIPMRPPSHPEDTFTVDAGSYSTLPDIDATLHTNPTHTPSAQSSATVIDGSHSGPAAPQAPCDPVPPGSSPSTPRLIMPNLEEQNNIGSCPDFDLDCPETVLGEASPSQARPWTPSNGPSTPNLTFAPATLAQCTSDTSSSTMHTAICYHNAQQDIADAIPLYGNQGQAEQTQQSPSSSEAGHSNQIREMPPDPAHLQVNAGHQSTEQHQGAVETNTAPPNTAIPDRLDNLQPDRQSQAPRVSRANGTGADPKQNDRQDESCGEGNNSWRDFPGGQAQETQEAQGRRGGRGGRGGRRRGRRRNGRG